MSLFVDLERPAVLFATEGKDASTVERFKNDLINHGGAPEAIKEICSDMSSVFISGVEKYFPGTPITFDKFHVVKILNAAVDEVRRQETKVRPELKGSRYLWLKNRSSLKAQQSDRLDQLSLKKRNLKTSRAYQIKLNFQELYQQPAESAEAYLKKALGRHLALVYIKDQ